MKKIIKELATLGCLLVVLMLPFFVFAGTTNWDSPLSTLEQIASGGERAAFAPADETSLSKIIGVAIGAVLSLLGVIFIILIISAGFKWMTANGNDEAITKAKSTMTQAIIGLVIVLSAYALWAFISSTLLYS